ncbi:hypothetical protein ACFY4C_34195 [Actinomadura viridis]|uniref:hypothetical protein n=1 Tax=Actinomadura viridis TaxID=58110 RepID=UPI0036A97709
MVPEPDWWRREPGLWPLLDFDGGTDEDGLPCDASASDRRALLEALLLERGADGDGPRPGPRDRDLLLHLLRQETLWQRHAWGFGHSIGMAALMVAEGRRPADLWPLWEAKSASFDTMLGLPVELLYAAGGPDTVAFAEAAARSRGASLLDYLGWAGTPDPEDVDRTLAALRRRYTGLSGHRAP